MSRAIKVSAALCASSLLLLAQGWKGFLVDRKCFEALERNANPLDSNRAVDRNLAFEIRYCRPRAKTQSFIFVQQNGLDFRLDLAGDRKAADLVRTSGRKASDWVNVAGQKSDRTIRVISIFSNP